MLIEQNNVIYTYRLPAIVVISDRIIERFNPYNIAAPLKSIPAVRLCHTHFCCPDIQQAQVFSHTVLTVYRFETGWMFTATGFHGACKVWLSNDRSEITVDTSEDTEDTDLYYRLLQAALETVSTFYGVISLHCSCLETDKGAVAFTAPSGTGKSTRANAWKQAYTSSFISGDRPELLIKDNAVFACGVPWDGKEKVYRNIFVPINGIFDIRRSSKDFLRYMSRRQILALLAKQCFIPMWDPLASAVAIHTIKKIAEISNVYRCFSGPDASSARTIYEMLVSKKGILAVANDIRIRKEFVLPSDIAARSELTKKICDTLKQPMSIDDLGIVINEGRDERDAYRDEQIKEVLKKLTESEMIEEII